MERSKAIDFAVAASGIFLFGVCHDYMQEAVFKIEGFQHGWFMTLCELCAFVLGPLFHVSPESLKTTNWSSYIYLTIVLAVTQGCGSVALAYVNFPVKVVMKSTKLIPTMLLGCLIKRRYSAAEYLSAIILCIGVASFTLVDSSVQPNFSLFGILLLVLAVVGDALTVNAQEKLLRVEQCSKEEMLLYSNLMAAGWTFLAFCFSGELRTLPDVVAGSPRVLAMLCAQATFMFLGVRCYLSIVKTSGGVAAVCVTSCRKVLTIAISFIAFAKPWSPAYLPTGMVTICGVALSVYAKQQNAKQTQMQPQTRRSLKTLPASAPTNV